MAKKTISQRIALEGGDAIKGTLKDLGQTGEKAFKQIEEATKRTNSPAAEFGKSMQRVRTQLADVGKAAGRMRGDVGRLNKSFGDLGRAAGTVATRIGLITGAAGLAAAGLFNLAKSGAEAADTALKQAQEFGVTVDAYGRLSFAAEQSGVSQDELRAAMARVNREVGEVNKGNKTSIARFDALGVSVKNAKGELRPTEDILADIADRFAVMPDSAAKSALAIDLMGRSGARMVPLLNAGSKGMADLGAQAESLGIVFTREQAVIAEGMNDALNALSRARKGVADQIGLLFAPTVTAAAQSLTRFIIENRQAMEDLAEHGLQTALPILRDFVNLLAGNDAAVESLWMLEARDAVRSFTQTLTSAVRGIIVPAFQAVQSAADFVGDAINGVFGTDFTGAEILIAATVAKIIGAFGLLSAAAGVVSASISLVVSSVGLLAPLAGLFGATFAALQSGAALALSALTGLLGWPLLLIGALAAAGVAIYAFWDEIVVGAEYLWDGLKSLFSAGAGYLSQWAADIGDVLAQAWVGARVSAAGLFEWLSERASGVTEFVGSAWLAMGEVIAQVWANVRQVAEDSYATAEGIFQSGFDTIFTGILAAADVAWQGLIAGFEFVGDVILGVFNGVVSSVATMMNSITSIIEKAAKAVAGLFSSASSGAQNLSGSKAPIVTGFAGGGHVRGAGTPTSDSIPAFLSDTEFVQQAKAVRYYGVDFMHLLNGLKIKRETLFAALRGLAPRRFATGGLAATRTEIPRFSTGGLARFQDFRFTPQIALAAMTTGIMPAPLRLAEGGPVSAPAEGHPLSLTFGGQTVDGLTATPDAAVRLQRLAAQQGMVSAGRRPSWFGKSR